MTREYNRKFRLRNGIVIQENYRRDTFTCEKNGYIDDYVVIVGNEKYDAGEAICLTLREDGMPVGGCRGEEYDVVEEIFEEQE